jgi:hypothetical protein
MEGYPLMDMKEWLKTAEDIIVIGRVGDQIDVRTEVDVEEALAVVEVVYEMLLSAVEGDVESVDKLH